MCTPFTGNAGQNTVVTRKFSFDQWKRLAWPTHSAWMCERETLAGYADCWPPVVFAQSSEKLLMSVLRLHTTCRQPKHKWCCAVEMATLPHELTPGNKIRVRNMTTINVLHYSNHKYKIKTTILILAKLNAWGLHPYVCK